MEKIKFTDHDTEYSITSIQTIMGHTVVLQGPGIPTDNTSGFYTVENGGITGDYAAFTTVFNILTPLKDIAILTIYPDNIESDSNPLSLYYIVPTPEMSEDMLKEMKEEKISQSKIALAEYLEANPILLNVHGGRPAYYSVTADKQTLMTMQYSTYQVQKAIAPETARLTWNAAGEECEEWTETEFLQLILAVKQYVYPLVSHQQTLESTIRACKTEADLETINIDYSGVPI